MASQSARLIDGTTLEAVISHEGKVRVEALFESGRRLTIPQLRDVLEAAELMDRIVHEPGTPR